MRIRCMGWSTPEEKCSADGSAIGHGLYLCLRCQENTLRDLLRLKKQRDTDTRQLKRLAESEAGGRRPQMDIRKGPMRTEVLGGKFESNRSKF